MARFVSTCIALLLAAIALPTSVTADTGHGGHYVLRPGKESTSYSATITATGQSISIDVRARSSYSGAYTVPGASSGSSAVYASNPSASSGGRGSATGSTSIAVTDTWYDPIRGTYSRTVDGHVYQLTGVNVSTGSTGKDGWVTAGLRQHPGAVPQALYVDGHFEGIVWVPTGTKQSNVQLASAPVTTPAGDAGASIVIDPRVVAMDVLQQVPLPDAQIRINPALGLVAMPAWFWVDGYNGQPFGGSATVGSYTVAVQVQPTSITWDFGDGTRLVSQSLGKAYPAESDVQHTYQYSSLHFPAGFPIRLTIQFAAMYSVNGGPEEPLSSMERTYTAGYRVQELQSVLTEQ